MYFKDICLFFICACLKDKQVRKPFVLSDWKHICQQNLPTTQSCTTFPTRDVKVYFGILPFRWGWVGEGILKHICNNYLQWWFQILLHICFLDFNPELPGEMIQFDGWFNHQAATRNWSDMEEQCVRQLGFFI